MRVAKRELILEEETRTLSVFRHIVGTIPRDDPWWAIMQRYVHYMATKVDALGGNASTVNDNPDGSGRPVDPQGPDDDDCGCCCEDDDDCSDDRHNESGKKECEGFIGHVCAVHYRSDGKFDGFTLQSCGIAGKEKTGEEKRFIKSDEDGVEKVVVSKERK